MDRRARLREQLQSVEGRMQRLGQADEPLVVVDYAHTPDAFGKALLALPPLVPSPRRPAALRVRLRRQPRRHQAAADGSRIAERIAHHAVLTTDNPSHRSAGGHPGRHGQGLADQAAVRGGRPCRAIRQTIGRGRPGTSWWIAGKGHEDYQETAGVKHPFSDMAVRRRRLRCEAHMGLRHQSPWKSGPAAGDAAALVQRVPRNWPACTDTRTLQAGDLFVALRGERFDAHDFQAQAQPAGSALAERGLAEAA